MHGNCLCLRGLIFFFFFFFKWSPAAIKRLGNYLMSVKITAYKTKAPLMSQNMLIVRSQIMLTSDHKLCSRHITDYAHVRSQTMPTSDHRLCPRQITDYAHVRSQTMLTSDHRLCPRQITDYAHVKSQTMLTGIRSRSSEKEKRTLRRGPVASAPTIKTTELMFSVNSTSTASCCGQIFFILTQTPMHVIKYYSKQTPIHIIKCDLKNDNRI